MWTTLPIWLTDPKPETIFYFSCRIDLNPCIYIYQCQRLFLPINQGFLSPTSPFGPLLPLTRGYYLKHSCCFVVKNIALSNVDGLCPPCTFKAITEERCALNLWHTAVRSQRSVSKRITALWNSENWNEKHLNFDRVFESLDHSQTSSS